MSDNKKSRRGFGKGYYIALILCAAAIGITGYLYNRNANRSQEALESEEPAQALAPSDSGDVAAIATTQPRQEAQASATEGTATGGESTSLKTTCPVSGTQVMEYAMETLQYNETTRDWRTHDGLDIAADAGTEVVAAADGQVYTIYQDDTMGTTVVIRHTGGYTTKYASLDENLAVSVGDRVTRGQVIGTVGNTALVETVMGPHVHFSVTCQDILMDPMDFLAMN